jgi:carbonic anhydrase/acetyltransferase-like protein (isoleucine patch superfamily)
MRRPYRGILPRVHPAAFIDQSARVVGDVEIGEDSSVRLHAVLRGDVPWIRIGRQTSYMDANVML